MSCRTCALSPAIFLPFRTARLSYNSFKLARLSPTILLHTFTTLASTKLKQSELWTKCLWMSKRHSVTPLLCDYVYARPSVYSVIIRRWRWTDLNQSFCISRAFWWDAGNALTLLFVCLVCLFLLQYFFLCNNKWICDKAQKRQWHMKCRICALRLLLLFCLGGCFVVCSNVCHWAGL